MSVSTKHDDVCYSTLFSFPPDGPANKMLNSLFCIVKINLPDRRSFNYGKVSKLLSTIKCNKIILYQMEDNAQPKLLETNIFNVSN